MKIIQNNVAVVTDLHIGIHQNHQLWHSIVIKFAHWFKKQIDAKGIKDIIICGDINDNRNEIDVTSMHVLTEVFSIWKDYNIIILVGNHDAYYRDRSDVNSLSILSGWPNITIVDSIKEIKAFDKHITFVPWGVEYNDIPESDIIFGHLEINGFSMTRMNACIKGIETKNILDKAPLVVSGHFHLRDNRKYKSGRVLYVGSPYEQNWGDCGTDPRGFYFIDLKTNKCDFVENTVSPRHKKIRLSEIASVGKLTPAIKKEFPNNFVSLIIDQEIKEQSIIKLMEILNTLGAVALKVDHAFENKFELDENSQEFDGVDVVKCISDFVELVDNMDYKPEVLEQIKLLYADCVKT